MGVMGGTHLSSQTDVYLYSMTVFVVQYVWHTRTRRQPQCGQQSPQALQAVLPPQALQAVPPPQVLQAVSPPQGAAPACNDWPPSKASPINP
jgi:hypothetical protein